eukprot:TRINITY_DN286_c4_g1_i1.p1 TRINITY_DN286_c4_g1~~TRINITY_DN286_c4_g1_i1.p1  ORF type:complete len:211 (-),score=7.10 TRINITY_DN286_c4_g1_i1:49-681(-)
MSIEFNIALTGDVNVGKSSLIKRYIDDVFCDDSSSINFLDYNKKYVNKDGESVELKIYDTVGQERFSSMTSSYYRSLDLILICFDISDKNSLSNVVQWNKEVDTYSEKKDIIKILVGTKADLESERMIEPVEARRLAEELGIEYYEVSSKIKNDKFSVDHLFDTVVDQLMVLHNNREFDQYHHLSSLTSVNLLDEKKEKTNPLKKKCCIM